MKDGDYTIYVLQYKTSMVSKDHANPDSKMIPYEVAKPNDANDWHDCGRDGWSAATDPVTWKQGVPTWKGRKAHADFDYTQRQTGRGGWHSLKHALRALKRARKLDPEGAFDWREDYRLYHRRVRHTFQLVKVRLAQCTNPVTEKEIVEAVA